MLSMEPRRGVAATVSDGARRAGHRSVWVQFAIKRGVGFVVTLVVLILVTFFLVRLIPGDPAVSIAGIDATPQEVGRVRHQLGLDVPMLQQLWDYTIGVLHGDLGRSFALPSPVRDVILARLPFTAIIAVAAMVIVLVVSVPLGMAVGIVTKGGRRRWLDATFGFVTALIGTIPGYVMATFLVVVFAVTFRWLPPAYTVTRPVASFALPILGLAIGPTCVIARIVRREAAVVLAQDFMRTTQGWRLPPVRRYLRYALPSLLTSTLTVSGMILGSMLGGAIIIETVFGWPGLGLQIVQSIVHRDYPVIQGIILTLGVIAALLIILVDAALGLLDPRTLGGRDA
jgi:peptide/nickel transport system permease protein